jgi:hypothetical protein
MEEKFDRLSGLKESKKPLSYYTAMMDEETRPVLQSGLKNLKPGEGLLVIVRYKPGDQTDQLLESTVKQIAGSEEAAWIAHSHEDPQKDREWQKLVQSLKVRCKQLRLPHHILKQAEEKLKAGSQHEVSFGILGLPGEPVKEIVGIVHQQINMGLNGDLVLHEGDVVLQALHEQIFSEGRPIELLTYGAGGSSHVDVNPGHLAISHGVLDFRTHVDPLSVINYLRPRVNIKGAETVNAYEKRLFNSLADEIEEKFNNDSTYEAMDVIDHIATLVRYAESATQVNTKELMAEFSEDKKNYYADICFGSIKSGNTNIMRLTGDYRGIKGHSDLKDYSRIILHDIGSQRTSNERKKEFDYLHNKFSEIATAEFAGFLTEVKDLMQGIIKGVPAENSEVIQLEQQVNSLKEKYKENNERLKNIEYLDKMVSLVQEGNELLNKTNVNKPVVINPLQEIIDKYQRSSVKHREANFYFTSVDINKNIKDIKSNVLNLKQFIPEDKFQELNKAVNKILKLSKQIPQSGEYKQVFLFSSQYMHALEQYQKIVKDIQGEAVTYLNNLFNPNSKELDDLFSMIVDLTFQLDEKQVESIRDLYFQVERTVQEFIEKHKDNKGAEEYIADLGTMQNILKEKISSLNKASEGSELEIVNQCAALDSELSLLQFDIEEVRDIGELNNVSLRYPVLDRMVQEFINMHKDNKGLEDRLKELETGVNTLRQRMHFKKIEFITAKLTDVVKKYDIKHRKFVKRDMLTSVAEHIIRNDEKILSALSSLSSSVPKNTFDTLSNDIHLIIQAAKSMRGTSDFLKFAEALGKYQQIIQQTPSAVPLKNIMDDIVGEANKNLRALFADYKPVNRERVQAALEEFSGELRAKLEQSYYKIENLSIQLSENSGDVISYFYELSQLEQLILQERDRIHQKSDSRALSSTEVGIQLNNLRVLRNMVDKQFAMKITASGNVFFNEHDKAAVTAFGSQTVEMENNLFIQLFNHNLKRFNVVGANVTKIASDPYVIEKEITEGLNKWASTATFTLEDYMNAYRWASNNQPFEGFEAGRWSAAEKLYRENEHLRPRLWNLNAKAPESELNPRIVNPFWKEIGTDMLPEIAAGSAFKGIHIQKLLESDPKLKEVQKKLMTDAKSLTTNSTLSKEEKEVKVRDIFKTYLDSFLKSGLDNQYKIYARFTPLLKQGFLQPVHDWDQAIYKSSNTPILVQKAEQFYQDYSGERMVSRGAMIAPEFKSNAELLVHLEKQSAEALRLPLVQFYNECMKQIKDTDYNSAVINEMQNQVEAYVKLHGFPTNPQGLLLLSKIIKPYGHQASAILVRNLGTVLSDIRNIGSTASIQLKGEHAREAILNYLARNGFPDDETTYTQMQHLVKYANEGLKQRPQRAIMFFDSQAPKATSDEAKIEEVEVKEVSDSSPQTMGDSSSSEAQNVTEEDGATKLKRS